MNKSYGVGIRDNTYSGLAKTQVRFLAASVFFSYYGKYLRHIDPTTANTAKYTTLFKHHFDEVIFEVTLRKLLLKEGSTWFDSTAVDSGAE